jgi:hypothetical protein
MSTGLLVLQLFLCSFSTSISNAATGFVPTGFPTNIVVQAELRGAVVRLWEGSPTFRAQCLKIGEHRNYRVAMLVEPALALSRAFRAQCVLKIYSTGFVTARVMVLPSRVVDELIPHELEHIVEHIEGVNVKRDANRQGTGAYEVSRGNIETLRAMRVGRQARQELEGNPQAVSTLTRR